MRLHGVLRPSRSWSRRYEPGTDRPVSARAIGSASGPRATATSSTWRSTGKTRAVDAIEQDLEGNFLVAVAARGRSRRLSRPAAHRATASSSRPRRSSRWMERPTPGALPQTDHPGGRDRQHLPRRRRIRRRGRAAAGGRAVPPGCTVVDYGIRGYDLAYALVAVPDHHPGGRLPAGRAARHGVRARARSCRSGRRGAAPSCSIATR